MPSVWERGQLTSNAVCVLAGLMKKLLGMPSIVYVTGVFGGVVTIVSIGAMRIQPPSSKA
jgi:hypothetical protein